jgi:sporulenol synthase
MKKRVENAINKLVDKLINHQEPDGRWSFCFESGTMTDSYMILLMMVLGEENDDIMQSLIKRILKKQTSDGTWKLYPDEQEGNLSATIESSVALLYAGITDPSDPLMIKAQKFIQSRGGVAQAGSLTKIMLTLLGHMKWSDQPRVPIEFLLLPPRSPINFFNFVGFTRVHVAPILIAYDQLFFVNLPRKKMVSKWLQPLVLQGSNRSEVSFYQNNLRTRLHNNAIQWGEWFLLQRIEADGTLYNYFSSTFLMIFALLALGYRRDHSVIRDAMKGLYSLFYNLKDGGHIQETSSTVWDTSLILYALQEAGVNVKHSVIKQGIQYLLKRQHIYWGDWAIRNRGVVPGGWGFSDINSINPDVDDTTASLRALAPTVRRRTYQEEWNRGVHWTLSMQNRDGGWSAFEKNTNKIWTKLLPYQDGRTIWGDPSTADLTGRTLEFIGKELRWGPDHPIVERACNWLYQHQTQNGSWFGRWGISYIYGTWAALTGLAAIGISGNHYMAKKGVCWLLSIQNSDGGWGESCRSDVEKSYVPLGASTLTQTAWALDALIAYYHQPIPEIQKGIECLLQLLDKKGWESVYPTGAGLAGQFYTHYHSYQYIWPLVTLSHYRKKYRGK